MTQLQETKAHETKSYGQDASQDDVLRLFEVYRETNDQRLAELEMRSSADVLLEEKLDRLDRALDDTRRRLDQQHLALRRPALGGSEAMAEPIVREHKAAFNRYVRSGESSGLKALEGKALSAGSGPDGGFLVPTPAERDILMRMSKMSPLRGLASVREISTSTYKKAYSTTGPAAGWVGETAARPQTASQIIAELNFPAMELYAMPSATQTLLDDAAVDIEQWVASEVDTVFAEQEGTAFVSGDGVNKPTGFLTPAKVAQSAWVWGRMGYIATGVSAAFPAANPSDALVDLLYSLRGGYRQNATIVMNRKTQAVIRKFKATTGEYLWQPPLALGQPATLMGFPISEADDMPDIAADSFSIAFGDFRRGYLIVDRIGVRVLRDPYSAKPYVLFYVTKRVGGGVQDFDAIKLLKFGVS
jgi:HK97 family phage major capsid protein